MQKQRTLRIEIEMLNDRAEDAIWALLFLANDIAKHRREPTNHAFTDRWQFEKTEEFKVKWHTEEDK